MGIQSRVGRDTTGAPPAEGRSPAKVARLLTGAGDASAAQTVSVTKDLLKDAVAGQADEADQDA